MTDKIILYDLARKGDCTSWSPNVWKVRLALNYKNIPYETKWITHPEITPTIKELGIPPNSQGSPYTLPTIQLPDKTAIMDSLAIVTKVESLHPSPSLHLDTNLHQQIGPIFGMIGGSLVPIIMPRIGREVLVEDSVPWYLEARKKAFGMSLDDLEKAKGGEQAWEAAEPGLAKLKVFLNEHKRDQGPFVLGSQVSYVDFMVASMIEAFRRIGQDLFERFVGFDEDLRRLHEASLPWMKDDR